MPSCPLPALLQGSGKPVGFCIQHVLLHRVALAVLGLLPLLVPPRTHGPGLQLCLNFHRYNLAIGGRLQGYPRLLQDESRRRVKPQECTGMKALDGTGRDVSSE